MLCVPTSNASAVSIDLKNRPGKGTTVSVKIPLTLAIIPAMMVECDEQAFAIPQASVIELLSLSRGDSNKSIEFIHEIPVVRLRGQILPLVILKQQLQLCHVEDTAQDLLSQETIEVIVLQADQLRFGLVVDSIRNAEEIVVKPLEPVIGALRVYSGATIMGDGKVTLILDITGIAGRCLNDSDLKHVRDELAKEQTVESNVQLDGSSLLLCAIDNAAPVALPLDKIRRLEEIESGSLEHATGGSVMQCRGDILPIVHLAQTLGRGGFTRQHGDESHPLHVVVTIAAGQEVGLVVDSILDVVSCPPASRSLTATPGLLGQAVINDRVTDIVDVNLVSKGGVK